MIKEYIVENYYDYREFIDYMKENYIGKPIVEAEYQGKKVDLGKVKRGGDKSFIKEISNGDCAGIHFCAFKKSFNVTFQFYKKIKLK